MAPIHNLGNILADNFQVLALGISCLVLTSQYEYYLSNMIWWLLYPFRGTTKPGVAGPEHPVRQLFEACGLAASRHVVISLVICIGIATACVFPIPFLYSIDFTNSSSNLPYHVWTSAQPYTGDANTTPDVVMRTVWLHGSYMKALEKDVIEAALEVQDELLGPTINFSPRSGGDELQQAIPSPNMTLTPAIRDSFHAINGLTNYSWFFHSPLLYWSCSLEKVYRDADIITTVNEASRQSTSVNVTLRHSIVFSGKRFNNQRLVAADTLVITLVHMLDSPIGHIWERKARELAERKSSKWAIHVDGAPESTLYEFRFQPMSWMQRLTFALAYMVVFVYITNLLKKLEALKSRIIFFFGVAVQLLLSAISTFTLCGVLKIDLSRVPIEAYPLAIFAVGLGSIFDFLQEVTAIPSRSAPAQRVSEAIGVQGPIMLVTIFQILVAIWSVDYWGGPSPTVHSFCQFVSIAVVFNMFFLMAGLLPLMSADLRRTELNDSLRLASAKSKEKDEILQRKTWSSAMFSQNSKVGIPVRIAALFVVLGCTFIFQWQFVGQMPTTSGLLTWMRSNPSPPVHSSSHILTVDIHQARSPTAWLQLQDHETAKEVIQVVKPHAHSYIARVHKPLTFVLNGSDRTPNDLGVRTYSPATYDFLSNHGFAYLLVISFSMAAVVVFMHYLTWDELREREETDEREDEPLLRVINPTARHALDIMYLAASRDGVVVTVGMDRKIRIWNVRQGYIIDVTRDDDVQIDPFPVYAIAIDDDSNWLAILSGKNRVFLWNVPEQRWGPSMEVRIHKQKVAAFFFRYDKEALIDPIVIVRKNGLMSELYAEAEQSYELQICRSPLVSVRQHFEKSTWTTTANPPPRIITSSKKGCVHVASNIAERWVSDELKFLEPSDDEVIISVLPLPVLSSFLAVRNHTVDLIDMTSLKVTHTFATKLMASGSLRCSHSTRRRPQCGSVGLANLVLAYTCVDTGNCIVQSYLPQREGETICFRDPSTPGSKTCCLWRETREDRFEVPNPGQWEILPPGCVVGVRKKDISKQVNARPTANSGLRRRGYAPSAYQSEEDTYEVWSLDARGNISTTRLFGPQEANHLFNSSNAKVEKLGNRSVVVALGNVVKVITVGHELFEKDDSENGDAFVGMTAVTARRKRPNTSRSKMK